MKTFKEYEEATHRTWEPISLNNDLTYLALGLCGEAGEVAEHIKKLMRHGKALDKGAFEKELGDVLWYLTVLSSQLDIGLECIASQNIEKLTKRHPNGFTTEYQDK